MKLNGFKTYLTSSGSVFALFNDIDPEIIGIIPHWISDSDERSAKEQLDTHYQHGGGWRHMEGWTLNEDNSMQFGDPNDEDADPPYAPLGMMKLRQEIIIFYPHAWVAIVQPDRTFEMCRMD